MALVVISSLSGWAAVKPASASSCLALARSPATLP